MIKFTDTAVFQPSNYSYFKGLRKVGVRFNFVKLTEGTSYVNPKASAQITNSLNVFGSVGIYHFWHGESAKFFITEAKRFGMDLQSTKVALDVEAGDLQYYCTNSINAFESQLVKAGFKPGNIWTYVSTSWINAGRVVPSKLKYGFVWAAMYPYSSVYSDNTLSAHSSLNPGYNAWQFSGLGSQDYSYDYTNTLLNNGARHSPIRKNNKPKRKIAPKETNHYLTKGRYFKAVADNNGYSDLKFHKRNGNVLAKGSLIKGQPIKYGKITRLNTPIGFFSTNTKYLKVIK